MGVWIAAGLAVAGSVSQGIGASKNAKAAAKAAKKGIKDERALYSKWSNELDRVMDSKEDKLYNLGNIFDRFESTGAFGDTNTLRNLRQAQEDFSALAAGDFGAFENQIRKSMSDALVSTVGSGSPIGSFAGLAADQQMNYRLQGVQTGMGITQGLSDHANQLLGFEFGIMDQRLQVGYEMDRAKTSNINNLRTQQAAQEGVNWMAAGNTLSQAASSFSNVAQFNQNKIIQQQSHERQMAQIQGMQNQQSQPRAIMNEPAIQSYNLGSISDAGNFMVPSNVNPLPPANFIEPDLPSGTRGSSAGLLPERIGISESQSSSAWYNNPLWSVGVNIASSILR